MFVKLFMFVKVSRSYCVIENHSYYRGSLYENTQRKVFSVLFEPAGSAESESGILATFGQCYGKKKIKFQ